MKFTATKPGALTRAFMGGPVGLYHTMPTGDVIADIADETVDIFDGVVMIVAAVGDHIIAKSREADKAHTVSFIKRWSRQLIRHKHEQLRRLGVDTEGEYVKLGGDLEDLQR